MSGCFEHDYESVYCRNCGGYCGKACQVCGDMTDGGEHTYYTEEWCHCDNQVLTSRPDEFMESDMFCVEHQREKHLVDYDDGSRYECPECQRERGEELGLV